MFFEAKISFETCNLARETLHSQNRMFHECNFTAGMSYLFSGGSFIIIGLANVLSPFGAKPLPNQMLTVDQI